MIGANQPLIDDKEYYLHVAAEEKKHGRTQSTSLQAVVFDLYEKYLDRVMDKDGPKTESKISESDQIILSDHAYYLKLVHFKGLRGRILDSTPWRKCPYCYQIKATEVDHYLPRSKFGEYSIYAPNLVPICKTCNGKKLNRYAHPGGGRRFLHPYFDKLPETPHPHLTAKVSVGVSVFIRFMVTKSPGMSEEVWSVHSNQFDELELATRYADEAIENITGMLYSLRRHFSDGGGTQVAEHLMIERVSKEKTYGPNHWWPVMLGALVASREFCDGGFNVMDPEGVALA
ncbi:MULTISPECIES: HNH endonuclease [unclassified Rhodococcus (in: high G+C Gram-positive bacteria)]|uniref:HNH endonuclease n=1 Tax=unclassified Rhodococcus (in: high G+C Gram-positive bacteria) TaxID=192944 RepID=UPI0011406C4E|nr:MULTISPECIES: HNH endonuclease [unclassified Rhodococcus (in: high G+C Gram-positive bacteria)]